LLKPSRTYYYFYKKGFLNSQAVRIRVKVTIRWAGIEFENTTSIMKNKQMRNIVCFFAMYCAMGVFSNFLL
jgi:hypothetical protein